MPVSGSIVRVTLDGREFPVAYDAESDRSLGGYNNEVEMNGNRTARLIKKMTAAKLSGIGIVIDDARADQEYIQKLADKKGFFGVEVEYVNGSIYGGQLQIIGEINVGSMKGTAELEFSGGELKAI